MFGVRVTSTISAGDGLDLDMKDLQLYVGCFQLDVSPGFDGWFYDVEVQTFGRDLVVCPPELREDFLALQQEEQGSKEAQADVENDEVREDEEEEQLVIGQEGVDESFEREKEDHQSLVEEDNRAQALCLIHRQQISLIFPELRDHCPRLPRSPLDGECELDDVELDDAQESQAHQRRFQSPGGAFIVLPGTQTSNGDISEELGVSDQVAEDVSQRDCAANNQFEPEENVEILEVCAGL